MTKEEFKALRLKLGATQTEFGRMLNLASPQVQVAKIEGGKVAVSGQIELLCRYLERFGPLEEKC